MKNIILLLLFPYVVFAQTNIPTVYSGGTAPNYQAGANIVISGTTISSWNGETLEETPLGVSAVYTDSATYTSSSNNFSIGSRTSSPKVTVKWNTGTTRSRRYWNYDCTTGSVTNDQHLVRLPLEYRGDTSLYFIVRFDYDYTDGGSAGGTTVNIWEYLTNASYVTDATNIIVPTSTRRTATIVRRISSVLTDKLTTVISVGTGDVLNMYNIQYSIVKPSKRNEVYTAAVTPVITNNNIDTTIAATYIVDDNVAVGTNGVTHNRLDSCLSQIGNGANGAWKKVILKKGVYWHRNIGTGGSGYTRMPSFVWIAGEQKDSTIVYADGSGTAEIETNEDVFIPTSSYIFENFTIKDTAVKYGMHIDYGGNIWGLCRNMNFMSDGFAIGAGWRENQYCVFEDCKFISLLPSNGYEAIVAHGTASSTNAYYARFTNCFSTNQGLANIIDTDSGQPDNLIFENCKSEVLGAGVVINRGYADSLVHMNLSFRNTDIKYLSTIGIKTDYTDIPNHFIRVKNVNASAITAGTPVKLLVGSSNEITVDTVQTNFFDYVTLTNSIAASGTGWAVKKGKTALCKAANASYTKGDMLKINSSGQFVVTTIRNEMVAICLQTVTISGGLLLAYLYL